MKLLQLFFAAIPLFFVFSAYSQNCPDEVSTDPGNPINLNRPELKNTFFWFPHNGNNHSSFEILTSGGTFPSINNPFWVPTNLMVGQLVNLQNSDFYPEDGWELLKVNFGRLNDGTERANKPSMPYMILYNRYSGTMRFLGMWPNASNSWQIIRFQISIPKNKVGGAPGLGDLDASNLLSVQGDAIQPLDQQTEETVYEVITEYPGISNASYFFWFDLPVAYDPCICNNDVAITLQASVENQWDVTVKGVLDAQLIQQGVPGNGHSSLVTKRIIGAAGATVAAIATGGSVVNTSAFAGLLDIFTERPGVSNETKSGLKLLQGALNAAAEVTYDSGKLEWRNTVTGDKLSNSDWNKLFSGMGSFLNAGFDFANPSGSASKPRTSVVGNITASGTATLNSQTGDLVYLGVPGSNWTSSLAEVIESTSSGLNPEYPIYNNPLGTFALLKTPTIKVRNEETHYLLDGYTLIPQFNDFDCHYTLFSQFDVFFEEESFLYKFNDALNLDIEKTEIIASIVIKKKDNNASFIESTFCINNPMLAGTVDESFCAACLNENEPDLDLLDGMNILKGVDKSERYTPPIPLKYANEIVGSFLTEGASNINSFDYFIRFQLKMVSKNTGLDGQPITTNQTVTFPLNHEQYIGEIPKQIINVTDNYDDLVYNDVVFSNGQVNYNPDYTEIIGHVQSTNEELTASILSNSVIHLKPGARVSRKMRLAIDYPFPGVFPQEEVSSTYVNDFCQNNIVDNQYQANQFSPLAPKMAPLDWEFLEEVIQSKKDLNKIILSPNPAQSFFTMRSSNKDISVITIHDLSGRTIYQKNLIENSRTAQIDLSTLNSGIYIVKVDCSAEVFTKKLIVAK